MATNLFEHSFSLEQQTLQSSISCGEPRKYNTITFKKEYVEIMENPYDCGCLIIGYTDELTEDFQNLLEQFMDENGYSKVIGTMAINSYLSNIEAKKERYKKLGYKLIPIGESPRYPDEDIETYLIYKVITPSFRGYP